MARRITEILKSGPRTQAEVNKLWKYREKKRREADIISTQDYMNRMDAPSMPRAWSSKSEWDRFYKRNAPKGWIPASAVKIVRNKGRVVVQIRKRR